jgi:anti-sigma factor RsiW
MTCSVPPELTDEQIDAILAGTAPPEVLAHLDECPACAQQVAAAYQVDSLLNDQLAFWGCPSPQTLGNYHLQHLPAAEAAQIAEHLTTCLACQAELAALDQFMNAPTTFQGRQRLTPDPPETAARTPAMRLRQWLAQLVPPSAMSQPAALRGALGGPLMAEVEGRTIFLEVEPVGDDQLRLRGQLAASDLADWSGALVEVRQGGELQATGHMDDLGAFLCRPLKPGPTLLRITTPQGLAIVVPELDLPAPED